MSSTTPDPTAIGGLRFGRYEVIRPIGEGGMGQVYLCVRRGAGGFEKRVVLKVMHSRFLGDQALVSMFLEEARLLARLRHPHIVDVTEVECLDGVPYLAMEYVDGPSIGGLAKQAYLAGELHFGFLLHLVRQVCDALRAVHELRIDDQPRGMIHRDVSSQNVLVDATTGVAKLIDFGVAKASDSAHHTQVGLVKGKLHYLAPEVLAGARPDARNDLYAVGVLMYRLCVGRLPYREADLASGRTAAPYVPISSVKGLPDGAADIIMKAMAPNPERRYQTAAELSADLARLVESLHIDPQQIPAWIQRLFPSADWNPPVGAQQSSHKALTRLVNEASHSAPVRTRATRAALAVASGGALAALLALGLATWILLADPRSPDPRADAELYLSAAEDLARAGYLERALELNQRARSLELHDPALRERITRQQAEIERLRAVPR